MNEFEIASLATRIVIGAGQVGVVLYGISRMMRANDSRARLQSELIERQERESIRRHTESMTALKDQSQALQAMIRGMDAQAQALKDQGQALQTLIAQTGARGSA